MNGNFNFNNYVFLKESFNKLKTKKEILTEELFKLKKESEFLEEDKLVSESARSFILTISEETFKNLEFHLSALVTDCLMSVDPTFPKYIVEVTTRRNQIECDMFFETNGFRNKPIRGSGGGALAIAGFGNRITIWSLDKNRPTFLLDEPFKDLSADLHIEASELLHKLTQEIEIQIIMVSHQEKINERADRVFRVYKENEFSKIEKE